MILDRTGHQEILMIAESYVTPRSQALYGSLVETFGPYPQLYTTYLDKFFVPSF